VPIDELGSLWMVGNRKVCTWCWCAAAGFLSGQASNVGQMLDVNGNLRRKTTFDTAVAAYKKGHHAVPNQRREVNVAQNVESQVYNTMSCKAPYNGQRTANVKAWLTNYCDPTKCNVQSRTTDDENVYHVQHMTSEDLYNHYKRETDESKVTKPVGLRQFQRALRALNKDPKMVTIKYGHKHKAQQECAECTRLTNLIRKSKKGSLARRAYEGQSEAHTIAWHNERCNYHSYELMGHDKESRIWSIGMDALDKAKTSMFTRHGKPLADYKGMKGLTDAETVAYKTVGALVHGVGYFLYALQPFLRDGANVTVEVLHRTLSKLFAKLADPEDDSVTHHPRVLHLQVDGASDNKNRTMFSYCEYLVREGIFEVVTVSFLIVGHTHADYDRYFVPITKQLRRVPVNSINDLLEVFWEGYKTEKPLCIEVMNAHADYEAWFQEVAQKHVPKGFAAQVNDIYRPHHFTFEKASGNACEMNYKNLCTDESDWNKEPVVWLTKSPAEGGPKMATPASPDFEDFDLVNIHARAVRETHAGRWPERLKLLANTREKVMKHFKYNELEPGYMSKEDEMQMQHTFDLFSDDKGTLKLEVLIEAMQNGHKTLPAGREQVYTGFQWRKHPKFDYRSVEAEFALMHAATSHERGPEPIIHSGNRGSEKVLMAHRKAFLKARKMAMEELTADLADGEAGNASDSESGDELDEDYVHVPKLSAAECGRSGMPEAYDRVARDLLMRGKRATLARMHCDHEEVVRVVGAVSMTSYELMYLVHYTEKRWDGDARERIWMSAEDLEQESGLTSLVGVDFENERVQVWWDTAGKSSIPTKWTGCLTKKTVGDKCDSRHSLMYDDGEEETLDLATLLHSDTLQPNGRRMMWVFEGHFTRAVEDLLKESFPNTKLSRIDPGQGQMSTQNPVITKRIGMKRKKTDMPDEDEGLTAQAIDRMKVVELKNELQKRGLQTDGLKAKLAQRLKSDVL
jgi:hypothetical protein